MLIVKNTLSFETAPPLRVQVVPVCTCVHNSGRLSGSGTEQLPSSPSTGFQAASPGICPVEKKHFRASLPAPKQ